MVVVSSCREMLVGPTTSATPVISCQQCREPLNSTPGDNRRKVGTTSNHHALYVLGYTRTTMAITKRSEMHDMNKTKIVSVRIEG